MPEDPCAELRRRAAEALAAASEAHRVFVIAELGFRAATGSESAAWVKTVKELAAAAMGGGSKKLLTLLALLESGVGLASADPRVEAARLSLQSAVERRAKAEAHERAVHGELQRCLRRQRRPWRGRVERTWSTGRVLDRNRVSGGVVYYGEVNRTGRLTVELLGPSTDAAQIQGRWRLEQKWSDRRWGSGRPQRTHAVRQVSLSGLCDVDVLAATPVLVDIAVELPAMAGEGVWTGTITRDDGLVDFSTWVEPVSLGPLHILAAPRTENSVTGSREEVESAWPQATVRTRWALTAAS